LDSDHKFTDMAKEFQIVVWVSARAHCINYQQQQKPDAYDEIMIVEQLIQSSKAKSQEKSELSEIGRQKCDV